MPILTTTKNIIDSAQAMRELSDMSIPVRTALKLRKIFKSVAKDMEAYDEQMKIVREKYTKKDADGKPVHPVIKKEGSADVVDETRVELTDTAGFEADVRSMLDTPVTVDFDPIKVEDLVDAKDPPLKIRTSLVFALDWLLDS